MTQAPFALEAVQRALGDSAIASVEVVERLDSSTAEVARLRIAPSAGRAPFTAIDKSAADAALSESRPTDCRLLQ